MNNVSPSMDAKSDIPCVETCPSHLHSIFQSADVATDWQSARSALSKLQELHGQCSELVYRLSILESIHRDCKDDHPCEYDPSDYTDPIRFIAAVGSACAGVARRLETSERAHETGRLPDQ